MRQNNNKVGRWFSSARMEGLELRRMLSAVTLKHGLMTVYGSSSNDRIDIANLDGPYSRYIDVTINATGFQFRSAGITRMRIFGFAGDDGITIDDAYLPNLTDVSVDEGDGNNSFDDFSLSHAYNRGERISVTGGGGNDVLGGGNHTFALDGGAGDDTLIGGAAGAVLNGGDGNDVVSAELLDPIKALGRISNPDDAVGSLVLNGGAGDDLIVGNNLKLANVTDTLSGGSGNNTFFAFATDQITDLGAGTNQELGGNQFSGAIGVTQTATLRLQFTTDGFVSTGFPGQGVGDNGPNSRIAVTDNQGTISMQGPTGSTFLLGDLLNAAGYPVDRFGLTSNEIGTPTDISLLVNGFPSSLTGNQIAGYQINNGDVILLQIG